VYPIHTEGYFNVSKGYAWIDIGADGRFSIRINGKHSGVTGSSRFSCAVVVTGYRNGEKNVVLNVPRTQTLTVGADADGAAEKDETFTDFPPIAAEDRDNVRNVRVLFEKNKSGDNFKDVVKNIINAAGEILDDADALYKKAESSEIGQAVATAAASGG
jgi:hypothetical protein